MLVIFQHYFEFPQQKNSTLARFLILFLYLMQSKKHDISIKIISSSCIKFTAQAGNCEVCLKERSKILIL